MVYLDSRMLWLLGIMNRRIRMKDYMAWAIASAMVLLLFSGCKTVVVFSANRYFEDEQTHTAAEIRMEKEW